MNKRAYIALADLIRRDLALFNQPVVEKLADFVQTQNPRFVRARWLHYIQTGEDK